MILFYCTYFLFRIWVNQIAETTDVYECVCVCVSECCVPVCFSLTILGGSWLEDRMVIFAVSWFGYMLILISCILFAYQYQCLHVLLFIIYILVVCICVALYHLPFQIKNFELWHDENDLKTLKLPTNYVLVWTFDLRFLNKKLCCTH